MNKNDISRMAREAGLYVSDELTRFAHIVRKATLEEAARVCDMHTVEDVLVGVPIAQSCAAAIRVRAIKTGGQT